MLESYDDDIRKRLREALRKQDEPLEQARKDCLTPSRMVEIGFQPSLATATEEAHLKKCYGCSSFQKRLKKVFHPSDELLKKYSLTNLFDDRDYSAVWWHLFPWCRQCRRKLREIRRQRDHLST